LASCDSVVDYGLGEYYVELATALDEPAFRLDNGHTVYDSHRTAGQSFASGDRIYLNFSYGASPSDPITVHGAAKIFSDTLRTQPADQLSQQKNHPIRFESAWTGSHYLNMKFYIEYRSQTHKIALLTDEALTNNPEIHLYFTHDKTNDTAGYWTPLYASFDLSRILGQPLGNRTLSVHVNTPTADNIYTITY
jgi:hypothetical protein